MEKRLGFLEESYKYIVIIFLISVYGIAKESSSVMLMVTVFLLAMVLRTSRNNIFYWSFFLIPNIRFLDVTGVKFLVNFLMVLPIIKYFFCYDMLKKRSVAILMGLGLFLFEMIHVLYFETYNIFFPLVSWALSFSLCIMATTDKSVLINKGDIYDSLSMGIIFSSLLYLFAEPKALVLNFYDFKERFVAYADDPNYFSVYILTCLSIWIFTSRSKYRYISFFLIAFIGFLTSSKMEFILSSFVFIHISIRFFDKNSAKKIIKKLPLILATMMIVVFYKIEAILNYYDHIIARMGGTGASIDTITTGRFHLQLYYLNDFLDSFSAYILGSGFNYFRFLGEPSIRGAHNTYIDILAAWGIAGGIYFVCLLTLWVNISKNIYKTNILKTEKNAYFPLVIFSISLLSLSCFSANMFPFLILANFPFLRKSNE